MSKFSDATFYLAPSGYKEGILFPQKPLSTNGEISFTRASSAWRTNIEGQLEETCYNLLPYSEEFDNAFWSKTGSSVAINSTVSPTSTLTADSLIEDTSNGLHFATQTISVILNTTYTSTIYVKANTRTKGRFRLNDTGGQPATDGNFDLSTGTISFGTIQNVGDGWYRLSLSRLMGSTSASIVLFLADNSGNISYIGSGTSSLFVWGAQLVQGSLPKPYLFTTNRQNFPRVDYSLGTGTFLLEPQRTNGVRNSTMQGTVLGTPGTNPTNWGSVASAGLNQSILATGIENGLSYVDYRFNGTATSGIVRFFFEGTTTIAAVDGQTWASSVYLKLISGTYDGSSIGFTGRTSAGASAGTTVLPGVTITSTLTRFTAVGALAGATVAYVQPQLDIYVTSGLNYDFTIRIAQPQIELGSYVTSPIFTTTSAVTRLVDSFSRGNIFTNNLVSASGGTWFVDLKNTIAFVRDAFAQSLFVGGNSTGVGGDGFAFTFGGTTANRPLIRKYVGGVESLVGTLNSDNNKVVIKWNGSTADIFVNGTKITSATSFAFTSLQWLGGFGSAAPVFVQQMALWNTPLTDAQCIDLTL